MKLKLGTVFWKDDCNEGHYCVVITPPSHPEVLIVNFTTQGSRKDQSCVLQPGDHPVIVDESVIAFEYAAVFPTDEVQRSIDDRIFDLQQDASEELLIKIWDGAFRTRRMTIRCSELLAETIPN